MFFKKNNFTNWGRNIHVNPKRLFPKDYTELKKIVCNKSLIIHGNQRSYGDVGINKDLVVSMENFNQVKFFNEKKGIIEIESGLVLKDLLSIIIEKNWFIPVTPGTKYVSLGGMIANNIHGKNIQKNQIKHYVKEIKLLGLNKKIIKCSEKKNRKIFHLTIGGFGLTGIILTVTLKLKKIYSPYLEQKIIEFNNYKEFFSTSKNVGNFEYSVLWIDNFKNEKIQGLNFLAKHSKTKNDKVVLFENKKIGLIYFLLSKLIINNYYFSKITHTVYRKYKKYFFKKICHFDEIFYPQDYFIDWNKVYGKRGFFEIQFINPKKKFKRVLLEISNFFENKKVFSPFIIIKKYNEKGKYLNFSGHGYSISLDFKVNENFELIKLFFNSIIKKNRLKVNFSKDLITDKINASNYSGFKIFKKEISLINSKKKINSFFSKRLEI